jgi:hypothetical protein
VEEKNWGCLKQTAIGCGVLIVIAIVIPIVMAVMMMGPFNRAVDARHAIEERFGTQEAFVPPPSGAPSANRIGVFLEVRRTFSEVCADLSRAEQQVQKLESFDDQDNVNTVDALKQALSTTKSMMGVGPVIGRFYEIRNQSLLDAGMGLGEFTYIFTVAYRDRLLGGPEPYMLFGPSPINRRVRRALLTMLESQLAVLQSEGSTEAEIAALEAEIAAMEADEGRSPWQDEIPPAIPEAFTPYRAELDELYCPAMAPLELMINKKHGPAVESL